MITCPICSRQITLGDDGQIPEHNDLRLGRQRIPQLCTASRQKMPPEPVPDGNEDDGEDEPYEDHDEEDDHDR